MAGMSALVLRSVRVSAELRTVNQKGLDGIFGSFLHYSQRAGDSSTSNWGTGEPPIDETQTQRGVTPGQSTSTGSEAAETPVGRQDSTTSTSGFDTGETGEEAKKQPKKSRTGGDMSDDGQVQTPHLQSMRSTRDMINDKGKETEDRLAAEKKSPS